MGEKEKLKIFEENKNIVFHVAKRYSYLKEQQLYDDILQEGFVVLWKIINEKGYEVDNKKFTTWVYRSIWGNMYNYIQRKIKCKPRNCKDEDILIVSLDTFKASKLNDDSLYEIIKCERNDIEAIEDYMIIDDLIEYAENKRDKKAYSKSYEVLLYMLAGYTQNEIAKKMETNPINVARAFKRITQKYQIDYLEYMVC